MCVKINKQEQHSFIATRSFCIPTHFHFLYFAFSLFQSFEAFKQRDMNGLGRRPPLQWCKTLRFLANRPGEKFAWHDDPPTTPKMWQTFPGHFLKKYEKFLKKDPNKSTVEAAAAAAAAVKTKAHSKYDDSFVDNKNTVVANDNDEIHLTFEKIIPNKANWKKKKAKLKMTEAPLKGLTALASFPVSDFGII